MDNELPDFLDFSGEFTVIMPNQSFVSSIQNFFMIPQKRKIREEMSGYPLLRFESAPPKEFLCAFCQNVVKAPLECKICSKLYCTDCVKALQKIHNPPDAHGSRLLFCSACSFMQEPKQPSLILVRIISELKIKCTNYDAGCTNLITIEEMIRHESICPFRETKCENYKDCRKIGLIKNFIESDIPLRNHYSQLSSRYRSNSKCYLCSEKCRQIVEFEQLIWNKQSYKALSEYYSLLKNIDAQEKNELTIQNN